MKKLVGISLIGALFAASGIYATPEDGKLMMKNTGCSMCHKPTIDQISSGMGSSLKTIQEKYGKDGKAALISFFKGEAEPRIEPDRFTTMKAWVLKTKKMTDSERESIADYILSSEHK